MQNNGKKLILVKYVGYALRTAIALTFVFCTAYAHSASKTVLVLGDSLSAEYGLQRGSGWVALLEKRLQEEKLDATVINASISGETTSGGKSRLPQLLKQYHPSIVVIELGGNDGLRGLPLKATEDNLSGMVAASKAAGAKALLVGMQIPPNYGREYAGKFSGIYSKVAKENSIPLVPFLLEGVADKPQLFQADRIHPLAAAHPQMLDNVWLFLKKIINTAAGGKTTQNKL